MKLRLFFKNPYAEEKLRKSHFKLELRFMKCIFRTLTYVRVTQLCHNKTAIIIYYYTGTWGILRLRDSVKSSSYSHVTSNFISVYACSARSSVFSNIPGRRTELI